VRCTVALAVLALVPAACGGSAKSTFTNPVYGADFPDPFVLRVGDTYYAYATNGPDKNGPDKNGPDKKGRVEQVQTATSRDLVHWTTGPDALPKVGSWTFNGETWAPEVLRRSDGAYVLYYSATKCVGRAVAHEPLGPFVDEAKGPLVCQPREGGSIDPSPFRDGEGNLYLVWKNDGNAIGAPTYIWAQRLSDDGLSLVGRRTRIEKNDASWEASVVEGPMLYEHDGRYFLFYSGNV
jgi:beta-xylosidase